MMPGMTINEVEALARHVAKQPGCSVIPRKDGYTLRLPNGDTASLHKTASDKNQREHLRLLLKRSGVPMPEDAVPDKINRGTSKRSRSVVRRGLVAMGDPEIVTVARLREFLPEPLTDPRSISGALLTMGYEPIGEKRGRQYRRPKALLGHEIHRAQPIPPVPPVVAPRPGPGPVRVIDTRTPERVDMAQAKADGVESVVVKSNGHPKTADPAPTERPDAGHLLGAWTLGEDLTVNELLGMVNVPAKLGLRMEVRVYADGKRS